MKQRILFVDDEPSILAAYRAIFRRDQSEREITFAANGKDALDLMAAQPFDILVSDMRMPGMSGADLMAAVADRYPQTSRLIVSAHADPDAVTKCLATTHQYISKPFDFRELTAALDRIRSLGKLLEDERLKELVGRSSNVPSLPKLYFKIVEALDSPDSAIDTIAEIIGRDPGMVAKTLQIVNSAFFGAARRIVRVKEAIQCLGLSLIRVLALGHHIFSSFDPKRVGEFALERVWNHSLVTSLVAGRIAWVETRDRTIVDASTTAGILHDIGKLMLADGSPEAYAEVTALVRDEGCEPIEAERQTFGASHAEVGAYLLGQWGLPLAVVEAVAHHHIPDRAGHEGFSPVTAVHVASALENEHRHTSGSAIDTVYLAGLGLDQRLAEWHRTAEATLTAAF